MQFRSISLYLIYIIITTSKHHHGQLRGTEFSIKVGNGKRQNDEM